MPEDRPQLKPLKWYRSLATRKGRLEAGAFMAEGPRVIGQIAGTRPDSILEIVTTDAGSEFCSDYPFRLVTESQMRSISASKTPQGILAVVAPPADMYWDHLPDQPGPRVLLLEDVQDPGNVGTLIRTAAAFDYSGVILTDKCADPLSPKCVQASAGSLFSVWLRRTGGYLELVEGLKRRGYVIAAAELDGPEDISVLGGQEKLLLALGNEAAGLSENLLKLADHRVRIPIVREKAESLNVAACGAIAIYLSAPK